MRMSLSDQIEALEGFTTNDPGQSEAKKVILETLRKMLVIRGHFECGHPDENAVVRLLVAALGEEFPKPDGQRS